MNLVLFAYMIMINNCANFLLYANCQCQNAMWCCELFLSMTGIDKAEPSGLIFHVYNPMPDLLLASNQLILENARKLLKEKQSANNKMSFYRGFDKCEGFFGRCFDCMLIPREANRYSRQEIKSIWN